VKRVAVAVAAVFAALAGHGGATLRATDYCREPGEQAVWMRASDGARVYGVAVGSGPTGLVLAHQFGSDHCEFMYFARDMAARGYRSLSIDLRDNGVSRGGAPGRYDRDVAAAVRWLRAHGSERVKLVGASMGATAVLVAASTVVPRVDGVVSLSAPAEYDELDALRAVARSRVPVRFVAGMLDTRFAEDAKRLVHASAAKDKASLRLPSAAHGSSLLELPKGRVFVLAFLAR
jgi:pimeloyl-ACP methyl ester carboxylesterase